MTTAYRNHNEETLYLDPSCPPSHGEGLGVRVNLMHRACRTRQEEKGQCHNQIHRQ
jgi:hypothetical protein